MSGAGEAARWNGTKTANGSSDRWSTVNRRPFAGGASHSLPDLAPDQFFVTFHVEVEKAGRPLPGRASARVGAALGELPVTTDFSGSSSDPLFDYFMDTLVPHPELGQSTWYVQAGRGSVPGSGSNCIAATSGGNHHPISTRPGAALPEALGPWSKQAFERLVKDKVLGLTQQDLEAKRVALANGRLFIFPTGEKIAWRYVQIPDQFRRLRLYARLEAGQPENRSGSGFPRQCRAGRCEHFAAALALVSRTQGIPTRLVKGFRGCDAQGSRKYAVHQRHAHTWVEAAVLPREQPRRCSRVPGMARPRSDTQFRRVTGGAAFGARELYRSHPQLRRTVEKPLRGL